MPWRWAAGLALTIALVAGCGSHAGDDFVLRGAIGTRKSSRKIDPAAGPITQVLAFYVVGVASRAEVGPDGAFSVPVGRDRPCGLVFLDAGDSVVGYLSLAAGVEAIPVMRVADDVAEIDLRSIDFVDGIGTPEHNPIETGGELAMSAEELVAYRMQSTLFASVIHNLDMNADGTLDVLSERPYWLSFGISFQGPQLATSDPAGTGAVPAVTGLKLSFSDDHDTVATPPATLTLPENSVYTPDWLGMMNPGVGDRSLPVYGFNMNNSGLTSLPAGTYSVVYDVDAKAFSFDLTSPPTDDTYIVATDVWYERLDAANVTLHWRWRMRDGSALDPSKLFAGRPAIGFEFGPSGSISLNVEPTDTQVTVAIDEARWVTLGGVVFNTFDYFGNTQQTWFDAP